MTIKALIYCRVSSQRQVDEGHGNESQEKRCRDLAASKSFPVEKVFPDNGISGGLFDRPAMKELLEYVDAHSHEKYVVIFDDLARFARDVEVHIRLKAEFASREVKLLCLNFNFDDSPESEYAELVLAAGNQYHRQANRRQVIQKMKARLENGYWPFCMPKGLINEKHPIHGKILVPRQPYATIYKEGVEQFRDGVLSTIDEFQAFCNQKYKEYSIAHKMSHSTATETLKEILYAGYIEYPKWNIPRMKARHEGFISIETFDFVQERLAGRAKKWHRKDYHLDFPLRPFVLCDNCGVPMTGSYNAGRSKRYPNYYCRNTNCKYVWKITPKETFENKFETLLIGVKPKDDLVDLTREVFLEVWNNQLELYSLDRNNREHERENITKEIDGYVKLAAQAKDEILRSVYEDKIKELMGKKTGLGQKTTQDLYTEKDFGTASKKVFDTLKKPMQMWKSDEYDDKRTILLMYFEDKLTYDYHQGFGTATLAYPIELITKKPPVKEASVEMSSYELESKNLH